MAAAAVYAATPTSQFTITVNFSIGKRTCELVPGTTGDAPAVDFGTLNLSSFDGSGNTVKHQVTVKMQGCSANLQEVPNIQLASPVAQNHPGNDAITIPGNTALLYFYNENGSRVTGNDVPPWVIGTNAAGTILTSSSAHVTFDVLLHVPLSGGVPNPQYGSFATTVPFNIFYN